MKPRKPTKPTQPTGMGRSGGMGRKGRPLGYSIQYTPEQTMRYKSQALRYSKAVELANAGPDYIEFNGQLLSSDDAANLRNAGGEPFKVTDRVNFRYASLRSGLDYWTVRYAGGGLEAVEMFADVVTTTGTDDCPEPVVTFSWENPEFSWLAEGIKVCTGGGGGGGYPGGAADPPSSLGTFPPGVRFQIYAMMDYANGIFFGGYDVFPIDRYVNRSRNSNYNIFDRGNYLGNPASDIPFPLLDYPSASIYPVPFVAGAPDNLAGLGIQPRYRLPSGWEVILFSLGGFQNEQPAYWDSPYQGEAGIFLAYGRSDYPALDRTGYYANTSLPGPGDSRTWKLQLVYDADPNNPGGGGGAPGGGGGTGGGGGGGGTSTQALAGGTFTSNTFTATADSEVKSTLDYTTVPDIGAISGAIAVQLYTMEGFLLDQYSETPTNGYANALEHTFSLVSGQSYYFRIAIPTTCYCNALTVTIGGAGFTCDCPDYTKTQPFAFNSPYNSEQAPRDWTQSDAGCDQEMGCKHIISTRIFLGLPVQVPTDIPL